MNHRLTWRKMTSVLLLLAMLTVSVAVLLPVAVSADPEGIDHFSYQALAGATTSDDQTDLRFLFRIDTLAYEKVGFVFSKSDSTPTIEEDHCGVYETEHAYSAINAGGGLQTAGEDHWWVAVKLAGIPQASYDQTIYVVGFVKEAGKDPVYTDVRTLTACAALGHNYLWTTNADTHTGTCSVCGDVVATAGHNFAMSVSGNVATYTCTDCGYSFDTNLVTNSGAAIPSGNREGNTETISQTAYDSDGDGNDDCRRVTMTETGKKYWLNYSSSNPTYTDGETHLLSFKIDIRIASGATPGDYYGVPSLFWFYYSFSGMNDQGYGFRFISNNAGKIEMKACNKETGQPVFQKTLDYDTWYSIRCDVTVNTAGSTNTLRSIRMYVDDQLVHTVDLANLNYSTYGTANKVRMMIIGFTGATVSFDIRNVGTYVGVIAD